MMNENPILIIYQVPDKLGKHPYTEYVPVWHGTIAEDVIANISANFTRGTGGILDWHERVFGKINMHPLSVGDVFCVRCGKDVNYIMVDENGFFDITDEWNKVRGKRTY